MSDLVQILRGYPIGDIRTQADVLWLRCQEAADEIERLRKDSMRYRWLRDAARTSDWHELSTVPAGQLDAVIDAEVWPAIQAKDQG